MTSAITTAMTTAMTTTPEAVTASGPARMTKARSRTALKSFVGATSAMVALFASGCGREGGDRPSADAIVESLDGAYFAADLAADEVQCFAQALHDDDLPDGILVKLVANQNLNESELDAFHPAAGRAAAACGFTYLAP